MAKKIAASAVSPQQIDVGGDDDAVRCDAGVARRLLVLADREQIAAEDRAMQHHPGDDRDDDQRDETCAEWRSSARR